MNTAMDTTPELDPASRTDPPVDTNETDTLLGFLDYHRNTFRWKTGGLTAAQLGKSLAPSSMTLGGMLKHVALNEASWFTQVLHGEGMPEPWASVDWEADYDWDWHSAESDAPSDLVALYEDSVRLANDGISRALAVDGLDTLSKKEDKRAGKPFALRWIVTHMIEEYARHNGHADLIRQSIDGKVGE